MKTALLQLLLPHKCLISPEQLAEQFEEVRVIDREKSRYEIEVFN